ncbi:sigma-70 family RNA polymerase sigma factor [Dokdonia sp.]|uniref:RNA polymerase sigma factor n=1 Tax=Dokdonia sp. TaxID=2024995 RepID=UPI003267C6E8
MADSDVFLKALVANDSKVILSIYNDVFPSVRSFVLKNKGQQVDAEDVFQKGLMQLAIRYSKEPFVIETTFKAYFFTVCRNLWRRELNKSTPRVISDGVFEPIDEYDEIANTVLEQERWELITEKMDELSDNCKEILKYYLAKVPYVKIMIKMEYNSELVVSQRVYKCKNKLIEIVKQDRRFNTLKEL